jgi:hypothetical protein
MITKNNIDEYRCFVSDNEWHTLNLGEKMELIALCKMSGEEIGQQFNKEEENLYYEVVASGD